MEYFRRAGGQIALLVLSAVGALIAIYLTVVHYDSASVPLVCSTSGLVNCELVLSSSFSVVPGTSIPVTIPGLLWFIVSGVLAFASWRIWSEQRGLRIAEFVWALLGMLTVFYLVYVEFVRLHTICAWCTAVHVIIFIMFLITAVLLQQPASDDELDVEEGESAVPITRD
jgi:uncharacterized membrane protein